jgi:hypothetical protein
MAELFQERSSSSNEPSACMKDELALGGDFIDREDGGSAAPETPFDGDASLVVLFGLEECRRDCLRWDTVSSNWCDASSPEDLPKV